MIKKVFIIIIFASIYYYFNEDNSSSNDVELNNNINKLERKVKIKKKKIYGNKSKEITTMMVHFFKERESIIKNRLSKGDFLKLKKIITKKEYNQNFNKQDLLVIKYLEKNSILKALRYNNISLIKQN